jgi:hypothetical protein
VRVGGRQARQDPKLSSVLPSSMKIVHVPPHGPRLSTTAMQFGQVRRFVLMGMTTERLTAMSVAGL